MRDLIRESAFGRILNLLSNSKALPHREQNNPAIVQQYMTISVTPSELSSREASDTALGDLADQEKGRDSQLVDWDENDPENPRNWSTPKKFFVTFQICLLTTSVYIGSAIYTAGLTGVMQQFQVSQTVALLGLTLFVVGYAVGPMILVSSLVMAVSLAPLRSFESFRSPPKSSTASKSIELSELSLINVIVTSLRNPLFWPQPNLHHHATTVRRPAVGRDLRGKHRDAARVPLHHRFRRESCPSDRWCDDCRHVSASEAGVWHCRLGRCRGLWSGIRTSSRWLCGREQGLDVDHLGAHVVIRYVRFVTSFP